MENIAFDHGGTVELYPARVDRTLDLTPDGQLFRDHVAFHPGALIDHDIRRPHLALNMAEYVERALAGDLAHHGHAAADGRYRLGRCLSRRLVCCRRLRGLYGGG